MGLYREQVVPRFVDRACGAPGMDRWRAETTEGLRGRVVEIGFGSGLNLPHYPDEVDVIYAVEPAALARKRSEARAAACAASVEHIGLDGQAIGLPDDSCDAALCTFTLCTIEDPSLALAEIARVLKSGGNLHFLEHGLAPEPRVVSWQRRIEPLQRRVADGCHLTRDPLRMLADAGFEVTSSSQRYARGPKPWTYLTLGRAMSPSH